MKCSKIVLTSRNETERDVQKHCLRQDKASRWITSGYHGYSYKLRAGIKLPLIQSTPGDPQLSVSTLMFPEDLSFDRGASLARWTKKAPRLISAKRKKYTPRRHALDDEYDFSYELGECFNDSRNNRDDRSINNNNNSSNNNNNNNNNNRLNFDDYCVASDINELIMKYERHRNEENGVVAKEQTVRRKEKTKKRSGKGDDAQKKRKKYRKTIKFSFSKPPSPETEQVIRVEVTSNVSFEETSSGLRTDCNNKGGKSIMNETRKKESRSGKFDGNNNERDPDKDESRPVVEEDFVVKCRQLALTQKKR